MRAFLLTMFALSLSAPTFAQPTPPPQVEAQTPRPRPATAPAPGQTPAAAPVALLTQPPRREGQPINVKVEVTITDQRSEAPALKKTVTVVTGDQMSGFIRTTANYVSLGGVPLNVDTEPQLLADGKIRLRLNLQYSLPAGNAASGAAATLRTTDIHENLSLILDNGKAMIAAQSADPVGDRQVTIEVKATILR